LTIEAEEGRTISWRPTSKAGATKLFAIHKAGGVHVKGFTLDGEDRVDCLVNLFHRCPGVRLEALRLQGFKKYGIWVTNCEGGESRDSRIRFDRLQFNTTQPEQAAIYFSIEPGVRDVIPKNRNFAFNACTFTGLGTRIMALDLSTVELIAWPDGVEPVQGK
jgi:hypothetical protein